MLEMASAVIHCCDCAVVDLYYFAFIHSNQISCSLIGSLVNKRSVLKMSTALRVLRQDCAQTARGAFGA